MAKLPVGKHVLRDGWEWEIPPPRMYSPKGAKICIYAPDGTLYQIRLTQIANHKWYFSKEENSYTWHALPMSISDINDTLEFILFGSSRIPIPERTYLFTPCVGRATTKLE